MSVSVIANYPIISREAPNHVNARQQQDVKTSGTAIKVIQFLAILLTLGAAFAVYKIYAYIITHKNDLEIGLDNPTDEEAVAWLIEEANNSGLQGLAFHPYENEGDSLTRKVDEELFDNDITGCINENIVL